MRVFTSSQFQIPAMHWTTYHAVYSSMLLLLRNRSQLCTVSQSNLHCLQASLICTSQSLIHVGSGAALSARCLNDSVSDCAIIALYSTCIHLLLHSSMQLPALPYRVCPAVQTVAMLHVLQPEAQLPCMAT